jgi:transcriptional regulator with XRE-family HTH domain
MTADELKKWRAKLGLSQLNAASLIGISRRGYQIYEGGSRPVPRTVALAVAAVQFDLPPYGRKK